jgi:protein HOOK3
MLATVRERDELSKALEEALSELNSKRNEHNLGTLEIEQDNKRLRDLTADLQERLDIYQTSLHDAELNAAQGKRQLDEVKSEVHALREKVAQLEDELDLAKAKALQLHKAEATAFAYKKKLDSLGIISQQIQEMEDQSTGYLRQIVDLENDNKQIPGLQRKIETMQEQIRKLEMQVSESSKQLSEKNNVILQLRTDLVAAENAKKMFEDEISVVRSQNSHSLTEDHDTTTFTLLGSSTSTANLREKIFRVEHENESLKKQIFLLQAEKSATADNVVPLDVKREIEQRDAKISQLSQDKAKLEAYSKMTLAKFQEKYMVALQECKRQLKEKTEKIEQLEMRAAVEKAGHKREEQLLSSSIYELGLSIMQGNLIRK